MVEGMATAPTPARWLLWHSCNVRYRDLVEGDVAELFRLRLAAMGNWRATWWACRDAISISSTDYGLPTLNKRKGQETLMHFMRDLRHAGRALIRTPSFTVIVLITLGLAIGANTVIFSVVDGVLLSPLPYDEPEGIVVVQQLGDRLNDDGPAGTSQDLFLEWRENGRAFEQLAMYSMESATVTSLEEPIRLNGVAVSPTLFGILRVEPAYGRAFTPDAEVPGNDDGILLSYRAWQRYFGGDPATVGTTLRLGPRLRNILGIMPAGFAFPDASVEYWVPMLATPPESISVSIGADEAPPSAPQGQRRETRRADGPGGPDGGDGPEGPEAHVELWGRVIGRLATGVSPAMAAEEGTTLLAGLNDGNSDAIERTAEVIPMQEKMVGSVRGPLLMLMGAVGFVLLIACANIANLILVRSVERRKETAVRAAIGAGLGSLVRYTLAESLLLTTAGGMLGLAAAVFGLRAISALGPEFIPRLDEVSIDPRVLAFTLLVMAVTALVFGLLPARAAAKLDLNRALKSEFGSDSALGRSGLRRLLVTVEIALAVVLLVGAGLLASSFIRLTSIDVGYDPENLLHLNISLPATAYPDAESHLSYYDALVQRLETLPGVTAATVASQTPYAPANIRVGISAQSRDEAADVDARPIPVGVRVVENGYFETLRVTAADGRVLNRDDRPEGRQIAVLSRAGAEAMFGKPNPVGEELDFISGRLEIVGVVDDARTAGVDPAPQADIFLPYRQAPAQMIPMLFRTAQVLIRTESSPLSMLPSVRSVMREIDSQVLVISASTVRDRMADSVAEPRFYASLVAAFALLSLTLAAVGIYGMLAYMVQQGVRDTAIRRALGAPVRQILSGVLREGMGLAITGLAVGIVGAFFLMRTMESMLFEIEPTDPTSFAIVSVVFLGVALLAVWIPARRATRIDPMEVLRYE